MNDEVAFLQAMRDAPHDAVLRQIFADWLEERDDPRGELLRLSHELTQSIDIPDRAQKENRLRGLLQSGARPVGPFITNNVGMKFAWIAPGMFLMGSPKNEEDRFANETQHPVTLTKGFYLAVHPVTQIVWRKLMEYDRIGFQGDEPPRMNVYWENCQEFLRRLSEYDGRSYRLPTEAEWEYACRAGTTTAYHFGRTLSKLQANLDSQSPTSVGRYPANAWGLQDMHGNAWEWCSDWYAGIFESKAMTDPKGPAEGMHRVSRGGGWNSSAGDCRSARRWFSVSFWDESLGFRAAFSPADA